MKWISAVWLALLVGCATGPAPVSKVVPPSPPLPPSMPTPKVAKARSAAVMSLTRAPLAAASASFTVMAAQTPGAVRDAHVIGVTVDHAYWNGSAFDLPIGTNWFQIFLPNPTQADFVQVDWSPDLLSWTNVGYFRHYTNGIWLVDPTAQGLPMRFYRLGIPAVMQ